MLFSYYVKLMIFTKNIPFKYFSAWKGITPRIKRAYQKKDDLIKKRGQSFSKKIVS